MSGFPLTFAWFFAGVFLGNERPEIYSQQGRQRAKILELPASACSKRKHI